MNLKVRIHDKEYEIAQGATFSEEYNETLDSGAIRIPHVIGQIDNLRPYDDVYIYESGYDFNEYIALWRQGGNLHDGDKDENGNPYDVTNPNAKRIPFYRHLLVNQYTEEVVTLDAIDPETGENVGIFSYSIELFSETKGLEMVQVPNCSVTQPLNIKKKTDIYKYLCRFVERYSPEYKTIDRNSSPEDENFLWTYAKKYSVSPELKEIFGGVYSQDFTLSNPTLRDVLSTLMITKDMIPYVKDNVIYAKAISERTGTYDIVTEKQSGRVNLVVGQMSSADYCDGVRRQYSGALSQDGTCTFVEHLGFRNKDSAIMTLDNMRLETSHNIYRIKKMKMCYYKGANISTYSSDNELLSNSEGWFLCKQDITPLVKHNSEWELLSQDWREMNSSSPSSVLDFSKYKLSTVMYNIGGNTIVGWGTRYNQYKKNTLSVYDVTKTYIENIYEIVDSLYPFGDRDASEICEAYKKELNNKNPNSNVEKVVILPRTGLSSLFKPDSDMSHIQALKTLFFEIEYSGFYDGALIHSRDKGNDNLFQNDNQSSSLTLLEKDGFSQKEKLNRFANKTYTMKGRLDGSNYGVDKLLKLGQTGVISEKYDDVIIYRREYSIYDNYILVSYAGIQDYVLKNFYTSVYARYRTNQLMSYAESTSRAETKKTLFVLSKNKKFTNETNSFNMVDNDGKRISEVKTLFSAFTPTSLDKTINSAMFYNDKKSYLVDEHTFVSGKSLCFNMVMPDNISGGNYITNVTADYDPIGLKPSTESDYYVGSTQRWYNVVDDSETGEIENLSIELCHRDLEEATVVTSEEQSDLKTLDGVYKHLLEYPIYQKTVVIKGTTAPLKKNPSKKSNIIKFENEKVYKDNKDRINFTLQVEPIAEISSGIYFSEYLSKLSDLCSSHKYEEDFSSGEETENYEIKFETSYEMLSRRSKIQTVGGVPQRLISKVRQNDGVYPFYVDFVISVGSSYLHFSSSEISFDGKNFSVFDGMVLSLFGKGKLRGLSNGQFEEKELTEIKLVYDIDEHEFFAYDISVDGIEVGDIPYYGAAHTTIGKTRLTQKLVEIKKNMFVEFSDSFVDSNFETKTIYSDKTFSKDYSPSDIFVVQENGILIKSSLAPEGTNSIRFWYFDFDTAYSVNYDNSEYYYEYSPDSSGFKFVFGVNLDDEDLSKDFMIFINELQQRDDRVFDSVGRLVGSNFNWVDDKNFNPNDEENAPSTFKYNTKNVDTTKNTKVITSISPSGYGVITGTGDNGEATFYSGEQIELTFVPKDGAEFYDWDGIIKDGDESVVDIYSTSNPFSSVAISNRIINLRARCVIPYDIWTDVAFSPTYEVSQNAQSIYDFSNEFFSEEQSGIDVTKIIVGGFIGAPLPYLIAATIDTRKNNSRETAVDVSVLGGILSKIDFKMWYEPAFDENNNKTGGRIMASGQYKLVGLQPANFNLAIASITAYVSNELRQTRLMLEFNDENIESFSVRDITSGGFWYEIQRDDEMVVDNKVIFNTLKYGDEIQIWAKTTDGSIYGTKYNINNPLKATMGVDMTFRPVVSTDFSEKVVWDYASDVGGDIGLTLEYKTTSDTIAQAIMIEGLINYAEYSKPISTQGMKFVLDVEGVEKSIIVSNNLDAITIADGVTIEMRGLMGVQIEDSEDVGTALLYQLRADGDSNPVVKLKKIIERQPI